MAIKRRGEGAVPRTRTAMMMNAAAPAHHQPPPPPPPPEEPSAPPLEEPSAAPMEPSLPSVHDMAAAEEDVVPWEDDESDVDEDEPKPHCSVGLSYKTEGQDAAATR